MSVSKIDLPNASVCAIGNFIGTQKVLNVNNIALSYPIMTIDLIDCKHVGCLDMAYICGWGCIQETKEYGLVTFETSVDNIGKHIFKQWMVATESIVSDILNVYNTCNKSIKSNYKFGVLKIPQLNLLYAWLVSSDGNTKLDLFSSIEIESNFDIKTSIIPINVFEPYLNSLVKNQSQLYIHEIVNDMKN